MTRQDSDKGNYGSPNGGKREGEATRLTRELNTWDYLYLTWWGLDRPEIAERLGLALRTLRRIDTDLGGSPRPEDWVGLL
jgi:hypothetical protein